MNDALHDLQDPLPYRITFMIRNVSFFLWLGLALLLAGASMYVTYFRDQTLPLPGAILASVFFTASLLSLISLVIQNIGGVLAFLINGAIVIALIVGVSSLINWLVHPKLDPLWASADVCQNKDVISKVQADLGSEGVFIRGQPFLPKVQPPTPGYGYQEPDGAGGCEWKNHHMQFTLSGGAREKPITIAKYRVFGRCCGAEKDFYVEVTYRHWPLSLGEY